MFPGQRRRTPSQQTRAMYVTMNTALQRLYRYTDALSLSMTYESNTDITGVVFI